jgi:hypothetical protein
MARIGAAIKLLEQARIARDDAARVRQTATLAPRDTERMEDCAQRLEKRACEMEEIALSIAANLARTHKLAAEHEQLIEEARVRLESLGLDIPPGIGNL